MATRADLLRLQIAVDSAQAKRELGQFAGQAERDNRRVQKSAEGASDGFTKLRASVMAYTAVAAGVAATVLVIDRLAQKADQVSNLSTAFDTLSGRIGATSSRFMPQLRSATRGLVTDLELMRLTNNAVILGVAESEAQFARLAAGAVTLGRAVGLGPTMAIESLVTGIGRQSRQMLDNLGIIVKAEEAHKKYAAAIGVAVDALSQEQLNAAFRADAIEQMEKALVGLNDETTRLSDLWNTAATAVSNAVTSMLDDINKLPSTGPGGVANILSGLAPGVLPGFAEGFGGVDPNVLVPPAARIAGAAGGSGTPFSIAAESEATKQKELNALHAETLKLFSARVEEQRKTLELQERGLAIAEQQMALHSFGLDPLSDPSLPGASIGSIPAGQATGNIPGIQQFEQSEEAVQRFGETALIAINEASFAAAELGGTLVDAAFGADVEWGKFLKALIRDLTAAIAKALILKAITSSIGGGGGGGFFPESFSQGGQIKAAGGVMVRGGIGGVDSVPFMSSGGPILAQRGEAITVLPKGLTEFLTVAGRSMLQQSQGAVPFMPQASGAAAVASRSAATTVIVVNASDMKLPERIEDNPQAVIDALRRASVLRA